MEFSTEEDLRAFLASWLGAHGHNVYHEIKCPEGGKIDILTQDYAVECRQWLTQNALLDAMEDLIACEPHITQHRPVVAGLTPAATVEEDGEDSSSIEEVLEQLNAAGIEVWFLDQIEVLQDYYRQLTVSPQEVVLPAKDRRHWSPWAGVLVALGMAAILAVSFTLAYRILQEPTARRLSPEQQTAWDRLHAAAGVWDLQTAQDQLQILRRSGNSCTAKFANRLETTLGRQGPQGFREINPIKRALNEQEGCDLEVIVYDFSP